MKLVARVLACACAITHIKWKMMMKNYYQSAGHPYRILVIAGSRSGKINVLLKLKKHQRPDTDKIDFFAKDPFKSKYQLLINEREKVGIKKLKNPEVFIDYSQTTDDVYENLEGYNPTKKTKVVIVFDGMIADMKYNKKLSPIVTELFSEEENSVFHSSYL